MEYLYVGIGLFVVALFFLIKGLRPSTPEDQAKRVMEYYHPTKGTIASEWQQGKSQARSSLLTTLAGEKAGLAGVVESDKVFETAQFNLDHNLTHLQQAEDTHHLSVQNQQTIIYKATESGRSITQYEELKREEGLAQVELLKHQGLKDIDWEFLEKEHNLKLKGALLLAIKEHREMEGLTEMYETLVRRRHQIETGADAPQVKQKLLERYDRNIEILDGVINGKGNRLLQEVDGENV